MRLLMQLIWELQEASPSYAELEPQTQAELDADWAETLDEPGSVLVVAERDGRVAGEACVYPADPDLASPPNAIYLAATAALPEERGSGVGLALSDRALAWAREAGHDVVVTNWRMTNLLASRFWPRRGYRETFFRLQRVVG